MKKVNTTKRFVPMYEGGSDLSEIAKFLREQIANQKPVEVPKSAYALAAGTQGGALVSQLFGLAGQDTRQEPFIPNASDVSAAFRKVPIGTTLSQMDNFLLGQQGTMARYLSNAGASPTTVGNALAKPMADAAQVRNSTALNLINANADLDRRRAAFNMEIDQGITQARDAQLTNENQKLAGLTGKMAEGFGAYGNLGVDYYNKKQMAQAMSNQKMDTLLSQLLTTNYMSKLFG